MNEMKSVGIVSRSSKSFFEAIIDAYEANMAVVFLRNNDDKERMNQFGLTEIKDPEADYGWISGKQGLKSDARIAQISFTSGTEGAPKGIFLTHENLSNVSARLNSFMEVDASIREYIAVPINYSFGLGRCRAVLTAGGEAYIPENGFNPVELKEMLQRGEINSISLVPTMCRVLLTAVGLIGDDALKVRWIEIGSQYMSRPEKERMKALFPRAIIVQHYGLTEASRSTLLRIDRESGEALESVGKPFGDTDIAISEDGRIRIRGKHIAKYFTQGNGRVINLAPDGWHTTQDLGEIRDGNLYFLGRNDDQINYSGVKISPDTIEQKILTVLEVESGICASAIPDPIHGNLILISHLKSLAVDVSKIQVAARTAASECGVSNPRALKYWAVESFPTTATGKVKRGELARFFSETNTSGRVDFDHEVKSIGEEPVSACSKEEENIRSIWEDALGVKNISLDKTFYDLGGDSLSALIAVIEMERKNIPSQISKGMLQGLSIREIVKSLHDPREMTHSHQLNSARITTGMGINIVRGILVLCVIFAHWIDGAIKRLPEQFFFVREWAPPLLAIGTPGFSIIYGVTIGFIIIPIFSNDRDRFSTIIRRTLYILGSGILALGLIVYVSRYGKIAQPTITDFFNSFYSVLTYYFLATATLGLWAQWISKRIDKISSCILASLICYSIHYFLSPLISHFRTEGIVEFVKLVLTAKYGYFNMISGTLAGVALGLYMQQPEKNESPQKLPVSIGLACILSGILTSSLAHQSGSWLVWPVPTNEIWRWSAYFGVVFMMLWGIQKSLPTYNKGSHARKLLLQSLATIGILAFPLFIFHEAVLPGISILVNTVGMNKSTALILALALFFGVSGWLFRKVHRVSFAS